MEKLIAGTDALIVELIPALRAFARTFCKQQNDADDLVQETLTRALAHVDQFTAGTRLKSWLFTIMRNAFYTRAKRYARESPGQIDCVSTMPQREPGQEWTMAAREVSDALGRLPLDQREVLVLVGVVGATYEEAATICNCAVGTIKSRLSRARQSLVDHLGETSSEGMLEARSHGATMVPPLMPRRH